MLKSKELLVYRDVEYLAVSMDIPEPLTTSFRNIKNIVPKQFDHIL